MIRSFVIALLLILSCDHRGNSISGESPVIKNIGLSYHRNSVMITVADAQRDFDGFHFEWSRNDKVLLTEYAACPPIPIGSTQATYGFSIRHYNSILAVEAEDKEQNISEPKTITIN